jgi:hypothetical protein
MRLLISRPPPGQLMAHSRKAGLVPYAEQQLISHSIISVWTMTTPTGVSGAFSVLTAIQL